MTCLIVALIATCVGLFAANRLRHCQSCRRFGFSRPCRECGSYNCIDFFSYWTLTLWHYLKRKP